MSLRLGKILTLGVSVHLTHATEQVRFFEEYLPSVSEPDCDRFAEELLTPAMMLSTCLILTT